MKNWFSILGVENKPTISDEEIKKAYLQLAKENHPDVNTSCNAKEKFQLIQEAYSNINTVSKRKEYVELLNIYTHDSDENVWKKHDYKRNNYSDVSSDFNFNDANEKNQNMRRFAASFERAIHPRFLLLVVSVGIIFYASTSLYKQHINSSTVKKENLIEAWYNPDTGRYETPSPWDRGYQLYRKENKKHVLVDRLKVHPTSPPTV